MKYLECWFPKLTITLFSKIRLDYLQVYNTFHLNYELSCPENTDLLSQCTLIKNNFKIVLTMRYLFQNTHVLRDFQRNQIQRLRHLAEMKETNSQPKDEAKNLGNIPRKLTFAHSELAFDKPDSADDNSHLRPTGLPPLDLPLTPHPETAENENEYVPGLHIPCQNHNQYFFLFLSPLAIRLCPCLTSWIST